MGIHKPGMKLDEAAERLAPIVDFPPDEIAGFVIVVLPADPGTGPGIAASENIPPHMAAHMLDIVAQMLFAAEAEAARIRREN
jgi:hypothetical protein